MQKQGKDFSKRHQHDLQQQHQFDLQKHQHDLQQKNHDLLKQHQLDLQQKHQQDLKKKHQQQCIQMQQELMKQQKLQNHQQQHFQKQQQQDLLIRHHLQKQPELQQHNRDKITELKLSNDDANGDTKKKKNELPLLDVYNTTKVSNLAKQSPTSSIRFPESLKKTEVVAEGEDLKTGDFVVMTEDIGKDDMPLWKLKSKVFTYSLRKNAMLQKFTKKSGVENSYEADEQFTVCMSLDWAKFSSVAVCFLAPDRVQIINLQQLYQKKQQELQKLNKPQELQKLNNQQDHQRHQKNLEKEDDLQKHQQQELNNQQHHTKDLLKHRQHDIQAQQKLPQHNKKQQQDGQHQQQNRQGQELREKLQQNQQKISEMMKNQNLSNIECLNSTDPDVVLNQISDIIGQTTDKINTRLALMCQAEKSRRTQSGPINPPQPKIEMLTPQGSFPRLNGNPEANSPLQPHPVQTVACRDMPMASIENLNLSSNGSASTNNLDRWWSMFDKRDTQYLTTIEMGVLDIGRPKLQPQQHEELQGQEEHVKQQQLVEPQRLNEQNHK